MIRFILIVSTFGVLSLAWYQMSGGADFEPGTQTAGLPSFSVPDNNAAAPEVARAGISGADLTSVAQVAAAPEKSPEKTDVIAPKLDVTLAAAAGTPNSTVEAEKAVEVASLDTRNDAVQTSDPAPGAVVERVVFGAASQARPEPAESSTDLRRVTGTVVNVRNGPGTGYSVVNQLRRGDAVEVLTDPGEGWVKLQAVDTKRVGWMSARFLRAAD
jgi:uncharacterized protein YgiM (DUF1202 family)